MPNKLGNHRTNQRQELAALLISAGVTQRDAAKVVGVHEDTICNWKRQDKFKELLATRMAEVRDEIATARDILIQGATLAALKDLDSLGSSDETIALRAASDILDRVGISKASTIEHIGGAPIQRMVTVVVRGDGGPPDPEPRGLLAQPAENQRLIRGEGIGEDGDREPGGSEDD